jgi:hypothetical protein
MATRETSNLVGQRVRLGRNAISASYRISSDQLRRFREPPHGSMMRACGILVVNRPEMWRQASRRAVQRPRSPAVPLTGPEVFVRYRGLDGRPWPDLEQAPFELEDGLADIARWPEVTAYLDGLASRDECDPVVLAHQLVNIDRIQHLGWHLAGVDIGYYESEYSHYSVILNEVIFGAYDELRRFAAVLNEHLLLSSPADARELLAERGRLAAQGADVEHEPPAMAPITVFVRRAS